MTDTAVKTPISDLVASALDAMRRGGAMRVMDIPDDSSYSSHTFSGEVSQEISRRADLAAAPAQVRVMPTDAQINSACLSYRHDFGLMNKRDQDNLRFEANEWLIAWRKAARILPALDPADIREAALREAADSVRSMADFCKTMGDIAGSRALYSAAAALIGEIIGEKK